MAKKLYVAEDRGDVWYRRQLPVLTLDGIAVQQTFFSLN